MGPADDHRSTNLKAAMAAFEAAQDATYPVGWLNCLRTSNNFGRSLVTLGEHATRRDLSPERAQAPFRVKPKRKLAVPIDLPALTLNRLTVRGFNTLHYRAGARKTGERLVDWDSYFYPLDAVHGWKLLDYRRGVRIESLQL